MRGVVGKMRKNNSSTQILSYTCDTLECTRVCVFLQNKGCINSKKL